jgi:hypothetical protein
MGRGAKHAERMQELQEINDNIQADNAELRRLLQVAEEEKQELQEMLRDKEELLAKLQKVEKMDAASQTEVYDVSSCSIFSPYETNVGMKILTKMGYRGGGLGINGQGVTQPLEVVPRQPFAGLGYGHEEKGECSKVAETKAISSPPDSKKGIKTVSPHQFKDKSGRYNSHSSFSFAYKRNDCFHRSSNRDVVKHQTKKMWVKKTDVSMRSEIKQKKNLTYPPTRNVQLNGKRRNFCNFCKISGHWEKKCWKLHPEIRHKSSKQNVKEPVKKEAPSTIGKARLRDESAWCWFGKQFIMFLQVLFLLCCKILSFMGAGISLLMENTQKFSDSESRSNGIIAKDWTREIQRRENRAKRPPDEKVASYLGYGR